MRVLELRVALPDLGDAGSGAFSVGLRFMGLGFRL